MRKIVIVAIIFVLLLVVAFCAYKVIPAFIQYGEYEDIHGSIVSEIDSIMNNTEEDTSNITVWTRAGSTSEEEPSEIPSEAATEDITSEEATCESESGSENVTTEPEIVTTEEVTTVTEAETEPPIEYKVGSISTAQFNSIKETLHELKAKYPDIYAYIYVVIPMRTVTYTISYPVMRGEDNEYYLNHAYDGTKIFSGAIFADFTTQDKVLDNKNLVIYGHNMNSGEMFMPLSKLVMHEAFYGSECYLFTEEAVYVYDIFAAYKAEENENYVKVLFRNDKDFVEFCENEQKKSVYSKEYTFDKSDRIITLSTCVNTVKGGRYAVHGILVGITK